MSNTDVVAMIGNLSRSLLPVQTLISGFGYLLGLLFMITAIMKLKKIGDAKVGASSQEKIIVPIAYFVGGAALIFLPSMINVLSNTTFGLSNILQYGSYNPYDIYSSMGFLIQTAGLIWFVRGCVLLVHSTDGGEKEGPKGLAFIFAGILAINFQSTYGIVNYALNHLFTLTDMGHSSTGA